MKFTENSAMMTAVEYTFLRSDPDPLPSSKVIKRETAEFKATVEKLCAGQMELVSALPEYVADVDAAPVVEAAEEIEEIAEAELIVEPAEEVSEPHQTLCCFRNTNTRMLASCCYTGMNVSDNHAFRLPASAACPPRA